MTIESLNVVRANDAQVHFPELIERVERGEEFTITKDDMPIARLSPARSSTSPQERLAAIQRILATSVRLNGLKIKDLIEEGRR